MKLGYKGYTVLCMVLAVCFIAGCVPQRNMVVSGPSAEPIASIYQYEASPLEWLEQQTAEGMPDEKLRDSEIAQITDLAYLRLLMQLCLHTKELDKWGILSPLYLYYQNVTYYDKTTGTFCVYRDIPYAPEGLGPDYVYTSTETAASFTRDILGTEIPDQDAAFGDWDISSEDSIVCRNGAYYILRGDYDHVSLRLRAYQHLGEGIYYASFDADDSYMAGPPELNKGNMPDYYRLLVVRSDSAFGFTILAKLKAGDNSLLPAGFPLPLYAV